MHRIRLPFICFILLLAFTFLACERKEELTKVDFSDIIKLNESTLTHRPEINICVGSMITPKEGYAYYKALSDYIGDILKMKVNFLEKKSYAETNFLLEEGAIDMAFICGGPYVDGRDKFGLELLAAPQIYGKTVYHSYIIVSKNSHINKFEDLRGKTFVFADPISNTGKIYPAYLLMQMGETPESFFKECVYSYAHDISIRAIAEGIIDAGAVDSLIWDYMEKNGSPFAKKTKIIKVSPPYGIPPVVIRPNLEKDLKEKIKQILLNMHQNKRGKAILDNMAIDKFVQVDDSLYDSIRESKRHLGK